MTTTRGNATLTDEARFEVLGLVSFALPGPWWWHTEEMNDPEAVGAIFRCYEKGNENELGYLLIADISQDPTEPDISTCEDNGIAELDRFLESEVRNLMARDGREMIRWMSSHLNRRPFGKALVTAYNRPRPRQPAITTLRCRLRMRTSICWRSLLRREPGYRASETHLLRAKRRYSFRDSGPIIRRRRREQAARWPGQYKGSDRLRIGRDFSGYNQIPNGNDHLYRNCNEDSCTQAGEVAAFLRTAEPRRAPSYW
jgi:hypothetical protein